MFKHASIAALASITASKEVQSPIVERWNDNWAMVDFAYGTFAYGYNELQMVAYGDTCFSSALDFGFSALDWSQTFNKALKLDSFTDIVLFTVFIGKIIV